MALDLGQPKLWGASYPTQTRPKLLLFNLNLQPSAIDLKLAESFGIPESIIF